MAKQYVRIKAPVEFRDWLLQRQIKLQQIAVNIGASSPKKRFPLMNVMRVISRTDGIITSDDIVRKYSRRRNKK